MMAAGTQIIENKAGSGRPSGSDAEHGGNRAVERKGWASSDRRLRAHRHGSGEPGLGLRSSKYL